MLANLVGRQELARDLGVHPDRVTHFTAQGMPTVRRGRGGQESVYDRDACRAWVEAKRTVLSTKDQYYAELRDKIRAENLIRAGQLVDARRIERSWTAIVTRVRDGHLGLISKLHTHHPELAAAALTTIDRLLRELLEDLAGGEQRPTEDADDLPTNGHRMARPRRGARRPGGRPPGRGGAVARRTRAQNGQGAAGSPQSTRPATLASEREAKEPA